ncbi:MAG TPA: hypothetical protein VGN05_15705 [Parvibaculum sp.]|jgi:hypothetical protein
MRLASLLKQRRKTRRTPPPPEETPRAPKSAVARALRHSAAASNYRSAAELGMRIATALSTIETAVLAIDAVNDRLREAANLVEGANKNDNLGRRALLAGRYDDVRAEIDAVVGSAAHNRINLINGCMIGGVYTAFDISLDEEGRAGIAIGVVDLTTGASGLALSPPRSAFAEDVEISTILGEIEAAQIRIAEVSMRFADHAALIADRLARLQKLAGTSQIESHVPTGADMDEAVGEDAQPFNLELAEIEDTLESI